MTKLFIVESPNKIKTVKQYLGKDYEVVASIGHTHRLPTKDYVDIKNSFKLNYEVDPKKREALKIIEKFAASCTEILYATDQDVEGSVIAWNLYEILSKKYKKKQHIRVNLKEITKTGIQQALASAYPMTDKHEYEIVSAGFLRRIEDRLVGFKVSPLAYVHVKEHTSAGRVQSPALRLIVEREREITSFIPEVYYEIFASLFPSGTTTTFQAKYTKEITDEKTASVIVAQCKGKTPTMSSINKKTTKSSPPAPFITKTLLSAASTLLGWKTKKATVIAQALFQKGLITYIRTDSASICQDGEALLFAYLKSNFAPNYITKSLPDYKNKDAKLEHGCIRPTDLSNKAILAPDEAKLYELIWCRFVACGMTQAQYESVSADISINNHVFKATGSTLLFDGFTKVWNFSTKDNTTLPSLEKDTKLSLRDVHEEKKETRPASRFKGASLIDALDKIGIGKPSTMDSILSVLEEREYIQYDQKQSIVPTELGMRLNDFLMKYFLHIIDFDFTAKVEAEQEKVMSGELKYLDVIKVFYDNLKEEIKQATTKISIDKKETEATAIVCPQCKDNLLIRKLNKKINKLFYSCSGYQEKSCMATFAIGEDGQPFAEKEIVREILKDCPGKDCGGVLVKSFNSKTKEVFYACTKWRKEDGACKVSADKDGVVREPKKFKKLGLCSKCKKSELVERSSSKGVLFIACLGFPRCRFTASIDDKEKLGLK